MKTSNIVAYATRDGERRVLCSAGKFDADAALRVAHAASAAYSDAEKRGVPLPQIVCVLEERADGEGEEKSARFTPLNPATLAPSGAAVRDLASLFAK